MKLAFMSSVHPKATMAELIAAGREHGYEAIELRPEWKHAHGVELEASSAQCRDLARQLRDGGLPGCCLSPGTRFNKPETRDAELEKLLRYVDLAAEVEIPLIRVFGDPLPKSGAGARPAAYGVLADYYGRAAERALEAGVRLVLETHMNCRAFDVGEVLYRTGYAPALWVNWHLSHCLGHGEDVDEAYRHVKGRVAHVHFHVAEDESDLPLIRRQLDLLAQEGFQGCFSVEVINPDDPAAVLARHAALWKRLIGAGAA